MIDAGVCAFEQRFPYLGWVDDINEAEVRAIVREVCRAMAGARGDKCRDAPGRN
jgi:hypothetical protein